MYAFLRPGWEVDAGVAQLFTEGVRHFLDLRREDLQDISVTFSAPRQ